MALDKQFLFIIGSPKSGTSWLQIMLTAHPLVCTTVELTLFSQYTASWIERWKIEAANIEKGRWFQGLPFVWTEDEFYGFLREFLDRVYERVLSTKPQATYILDKHPAYSAHVEVINKLLPGAKFIHLIRDGRDVAVSMIWAKQKRGFGTDTIQDSAVDWKKHVMMARKARQYNDRYMEVRYEDLLTAGVDTLKSVFDFCGLPSNLKDVAAIVDAHQFELMKARRQHSDKRVKKQEASYRKGKAGSWQEELDPKQRYVFDKIAGDMLLKLGYAEDGWWAKSRSQKIVLPFLTKILFFKKV